jgi:hypothetical protein
MPHGDSGSAQVRAGLVAADLVRAQYRNIPTAVAVNAIIAALLCLALQETVPLQRLGWWLLVVYVVATTRFLIWRRFHSAFLSPARTLMYRRLAVAGSGVNGFVWGLGGIILYASHSPARSVPAADHAIRDGCGSRVCIRPRFRGGNGLPSAERNFIVGTFLHGG